MSVNNKDYCVKVENKARDIEIEIEEITSCLCGCCGTYNLTFVEKDDLGNVEFKDVSECYTDGNRDKAGNVSYIGQLLITVDLLARKVAELEKQLKEIK